MAVMIDLIKVIAKKNDKNNFNNDIKEYPVTSWVNKETKRYAESIDDIRSTINIKKYAYGSRKRIISFFDLAKDVSNKRIIEIKNNVFMPFFTKEIIQKAFAIKSYNSFNSEYDRIIFRDQFYKMYKDKAVYRKDKGHTTSSALNLIRLNITSIKELFRNGCLVSLGISQWNKIEYELDKLQYGVLGISPAIISAISLELFFNNWG